MTATTRTPSRRTVARGAAWAVPAVAVAAAAPALAASGCVPTLSLSGDSCKCPGNGQNDWNYYLKVCNTGTTCPNQGDTLYVVIRANTGNNPVYAGPTPVPVGQCSAVITFSANNSSGKLRIAYGTTAAAASLGTAPYYTVDAPPNCDDGDLGTCPSEGLSAPADTTQEQVETPAEPTQEQVETPAEPTQEQVETPAEPTQEQVETPAG